MADILKGIGDVAGGVASVIFPGLQVMERQKERHQEDLKQREFNRAQERIRNLKALAEERGGR